MFSKKIMNRNYKSTNCDNHLDFKNFINKTPFLITNLNKLKHKYPIINQNIKMYKVKNKLISICSNKNYFNKDSRYKSIYVIFVRHCESCSNVEKINVIRRFFREPLCTLKGINETLLQGIKLKDFIIKKKLPLDIEFRSSFLPRAFQTAKLLSNAFHNKKNKKIKRICYISETNHIHEYFRLKTTKGTSSTTNLEKSDCHIKLLNNELKYGWKIQQSSKNLFKCPNKNSNQKHKNFYKTASFHHEKDDYYNFINKVLKKFKSNKTYIIVSHGNFIRKYILQASPAHPLNVDSFLIKYDIPYNKNQPTRATILDFINSQDIRNKNKLFHNPKKIFNCKYKYHKHIKPRC